MAAPVPHAGQSQIPCEDFMQFQNALRRLRLIDDRIVYLLNTSIPTRSFAAQVSATETCKQLYTEIKESYDGKRAAIESCILHKSELVDRLRAERAKNEDDHVVRKKLQNAQTQLRLVRSELDVERVLHDQTRKVYYERCRDSYRPPDL